MYSDDNVFVKTPSRKTPPAPRSCSPSGLVVQNNRFVNNRGLRAYGLIFQSMDDCRLEQNEIKQNAVGLSFNQCNRNRIIGKSRDAELHRPALRLELGRESFHRKRLRAQSAPGRDRRRGRKRKPMGSRWRWESLGRRDRVRPGSRRHQRSAASRARSLRRLAARFPAVALLSESPAVKLLRFAHQRAALPGLSSIEDPSRRSRVVSGASARKALRRKRRPNDRRQRTAEELRPESGPPRHVASRRNQAK